MARFLRQRVAIVERIEEVLRDEVVAVDEVRRERPALFGEAAAVCVMEPETEVVLEAPPHRRLQRVVDHRLLAGEIHAARRAERRIRSRPGLPIERTGQRPAEREAPPVRPDVSGLGHPGPAERSLHVDHALNGIRRADVRVDERIDRLLARVVR